MSMFKNLPDRKTYIFAHNTSSTMTRYRTIAIYIFHFCFVLFFLANNVFATKNNTLQDQVLPDSIASKLQATDNKALLLLQLLDTYKNKDSTIYHQINRALQLMEQDKGKLPLLMKAYYELGEEISASNWDAKALPYYKRALEIAQAIKDADYTKNSLFKITGLYLNTEDLTKVDSMMTYIDNIIDTTVVNNFLAEYFNYKAIISVNEGFENEAIDYYTKAGVIYRSLNNTEALASIYNNIGDLNINIGNYEEAIDYTQKSLEINKVAGSAESVITNYNNLGVIYKRLDSVEKAIGFYNKAIVEAEKLNNEFLLARGYLNIANLYQQTGNFTTAMTYFNKSEALCEKNNIAIGIFMNKLNKSRLLMDFGNIDEAEKLLKQAQQLAEDMKLLSFMSEILLLSSEIYSKKGNFEAALRDYKQYVSIRDSIKSDEVKVKLLALYAKYEKEETLRKISDLQKSIKINEAQERVKLLVFISVILLLISVTGFLISKRREAAYKNKIAEEENDKLRLNMELKDKELMHYAMSSAKNNELINTIKKGFRTVMPKISETDQQKLNALIRDLSQNKITDSHEEMEARFSIVHDSFHKKLLEISADLSPSELRMCSYLRLNLSTKDISNLTNRSSSTVDNARSSIRKKLGLSKDENLTAFLIQL